MATYNEPTTAGAASAANGLDTPGSGLDLSPGAVGA